MSLNTKFELIFPIAGEGSRFGKDVFKPFLKIGDITFIEHTFLPFVPYKKDIARVSFIYTQEQEKRFNVQATLQTLFPDVFIDCLIIPDKTTGPYQTIRQGLKLRQIDGPVIICDCDHQVDVSGVIEALCVYGNSDAYIPTWKIEAKDYINWSKVLTLNNKIVDFVEKDINLNPIYQVEGIIGCIGFADISDGFKSPSAVYISDYLKEMLVAEKKFLCGRISSAAFYGTPQMLENHVNNLRSKHTIFSDVDGFLLEHQPHSTCEIRDNKPIVHNILALQKLKAAGHRVILTTARNAKYQESFQKLCAAYYIPYDEIVMGLNAGPRVIINDRKPSWPFIQQARAVEVSRNENAQPSFEESFLLSDLVVRRKLPGNSFAEIFVMSNHELKDEIVRKRIIKTDDNKIHVQKLKRQFQDIQRFQFLWPESVPKLFQEKDTDFEYYYDMEYLRDYKCLKDFDLESQLSLLDILFFNLDKQVYSLRKTVSGPSWLNNFLDKKIRAKFPSYITNPIYNQIINEGCEVNGEWIPSLNETLNDLADSSILWPRFICPVHGDLTLENILCLDNHVKMIDMDASDLFDAPELDLGKLGQSTIAQYDKWKLSQDIIKITNQGFRCNPEFLRINHTRLQEVIINHWSEMLNVSKPEIIVKVIFYMSTYFIRFVPFREQISKEHGIFALIMAAVWLNKIHNL